VQYERLVLYTNKNLKLHKLTERCNMKTEQNLDVMIISCKEEVESQDRRIRCWITDLEYSKLESHKRCEFMYPIGTRIYCNVSFYKKEEEKYLEEVRGIKK